MAPKSASPAALQILEQVGLTDLPADWKIVRVEDLLSNDRGISVGVMYPGNHDAFGVPLIKAGDLVGSRINERPEFWITKGKHEEYRRTELAGGELLISLVGDVGRCAVVPRQMAGWNAARAIAVLRFVNPADASFLRICLMSAPLQHLMQAWSTTTVQATLNLKEIRQIPLPWPPEEERIAITRILSALDDKIELNRRMNETLEAIARALFKSWFVDFDPVRAKAEGRDPGLPKPLADLFPDAFQDSEMGEIPKGWKVGRLDDVLVLQRGFDLPAPSRSPGRYPVIAASGPNGTHDHFMARGPGVTTGRSGVLGAVFFVHEDFWPLNTSLWVKQFKQSTPSYAYHLLRRLDFAIFNAGSAVPTLNRNHVHSLPAIIPSPRLIEVFDSLVVPSMKRQRVGEQESLSLAAIRDTLLPKLISGELCARDAERMVEASA